MSTSPEESHDNDPNVIAHKKALVMTLGNAKEMDALLELLHSEENETVRCHIITVLAAFGRVEVIDSLENIYGIEKREKVKNRIEEAIEVIKNMSAY
jgi:hypothetical protein